MAIFTGTAGADSLVGADGEADAFRFGPANLGANDTMIGGGGAFVDTLAFVAAGAVTAAQLAGVSGIERIQHHAGGISYALPAALVASATGGFEARGGAGADFVDAGGIARCSLKRRHLLGAAVLPLAQRPGVAVATMSFPPWLCAGGGPRLRAARLAAYLPAMTRETPG